MNIALLNMMPDAALTATDRQYAGLLASHSDICLHPFTFPEIPRTEKAAAYIRNSYKSESQVRAFAPEAMIITGTNVSDPNLATQPFWKPLRETMDWARSHTRSTLCSCLASHAVMQFRFEQKRCALPRKIWGVYDHKVLLPGHVLAAGLPEVVPVPHSRYNEVTVAQFEGAGLDIIIADSFAGVHLAASADTRLVLMQGHPEYDGISLLKEYKREVGLYAAGVRSDYPPLPDGMMAADGANMFEDHARMVENAVAAGSPVPEFPEAEAKRFLHELWKPAAGMVFSNWIDFVGQSVRGGEKI